MNRFSILIILSVVLLLLTSCGSPDYKNTSCENNHDSGGVSDTIREDNDNVQDNGFENINETPVESESFDSLEDFVLQASQAKRGESIAELDTLQYFYIPEAIPEGYKLYKVNAGTFDIGFYYLPDEYTLSWDLSMQGESEQKHFLFISSRGTYDFGSVMGQYGKSSELLIDEKYLVIENKESQDIIIWEQDGEALMLYVPAEMNYSDVLPNCTASKYVRSENAQTFELEEKIQ